MAGAPVTGLLERVGAEGGETSCVSPDISADNLRIVRPPAPPFPEEDELPAPAAASGMVPVGAVPVVVTPVEDADNGVTLMVASGAAAPTLL
jgi:hypothetical protein